MADRSFMAVLVSTLAGPLIWAVHFLIIYGFTAVACARDFANAKFAGADVVPLTVGVVTAVAAVATVAVLVLFLRHLGPRPPERNEAAVLHFLRWVGAAAAGLSVVAILLEGSTAAIVPACK